MAREQWRWALLSVMLLALPACATGPQGTQQTTSAGDTPATSPPVTQSPTANAQRSEAGVTTSAPTSAPAVTGAPPQRATMPSRVSGWAPYPGEARPGDRGDHVRAWQHILIQAGAISDIPENHDGYYGPGMYQVVLRIQQSWGWSDADGIAGPRTYQMIVSGAPVPPPQPPQPAPPPAGDRDCLDFASQAEAQAYFVARGGSPANNVDGLDRDGDGIACEDPE
jgi:hypothetical protein